MGRVIYNKLIRDKIPEMIKADNCNPKTRIMDEKEYYIELFRKVVEEGKELAEIKNNKKELIKEISDIYEVIDAIIEGYGLDTAEIKSVKEKRRKERGSFKKKLFLEYIDG